MTSGLHALERGAQLGQQASEDLVDGDDVRCSAGLIDLAARAAQRDQW